MCDDDECESGKIFLSLSLSVTLSLTLSPKWSMLILSLTSLHSLALSLKGVCVCAMKKERMGMKAFPCYIPPEKKTSFLLRNVDCT